MIKTYNFQLKNSSIDGKTFYVNKHKVHSGVYTMLFYKVSDDWKYEKEYSTSIKYDGKDGYFNYDIVRSFQLRREEK